VSGDELVGRTGERMRRSPAMEGERGSEKAGLWELWRLGTYTTGLGLKG